MEAGEAIDLAREALMVTVILAAPVLLTGFVVALIVSVLQAVTQVQDQTLSFVPKIFAILLGLVITVPWIMSRLVEFGKEMFTYGN